MIKNIIQWFLYSSANPQKFALTLKAGFAFLVLLGFGAYITPEQSQSISDSAIIILTYSGQIISGILAVIGASRKIGYLIGDIFKSYKENR